jgi:hypothetical protein
MKIRYNPEVSNINSMSSNAWEVYGIDNVNMKKFLSSGKTRIDIKNVTVDITGSRISSEIAYKFIDLNTLDVVKEKDELITVGNIVHRTLKQQLIQKQM